MSFNVMTPLTTPFNLENECGTGPGLGIASETNTTETMASETNTIETSTPAATRRRVNTTGEREAVHKH